MLLFAVCFSRPHLGSAPDLRFPVADRPADSLGNGAVLWCPQKGRLAALHDEPSEARTPPPPSHPWWAPCEAPAPSHCGPEVGLEQSADRSLYVFPFSFFWLRVYF